MPTLKLFNSLVGKVDDFVPISKDVIGLYSCGLTVYDEAHLGHARTTIMVDILVRVLRYLYGNVIYVRNVTDVDDKINKRAKEKNITIRELTNSVFNLCSSSMEYINNLKPTFEPRATDNIDSIISLIQRIIDNGHAYISEGHVLFDVSSYKNYGALSHANVEELLDGVRVENEGYKKNPLDFVLWKPSHDSDDESSRFESPWGIGRPGWHIECSAMSYECLGKNFDIHCGGVDLKFPHHENEIAQSCCAFEDSHFANYWFHIGFLMINGEKMSKSLGNFVTVDALKERNIKGSVIRFAMMKNHYRKPLDFNDALVLEAEKNLNNLHKDVLNLNVEYTAPEELLDVLCDDINTPKALALLNQFRERKEFAKLKNSMIFLGIYDEFLIEKENKQPAIGMFELNELIKKREKAREKRDWTLCDEIRDRLKMEGIMLIDNKDGTTDWDFIEE